MSALFHIAFYQFVDIDSPNELAIAIKQWAHGLRGSVVVAHEGINGVLAGKANHLDAFEIALKKLKPFASITFKRSNCNTVPFGKLKVTVKKEIVAFGVPNVAPEPTAVSPKEWRELIKREDVVVLDNRNSFEYRLGKFKGAIDPKVSHFKDFPEYVRQHAEAWKNEGKQVAMYCTGGIRCEKSSAWMQSLGLTVSQLEGGILNYFQEMPDAEQDFEGECFVFDNRIAIDTQLNETDTTETDVYDPALDGQWRIDRAKRLKESL